MWSLLMVITTFGGSLLNLISAIRIKSAKISIGVFFLFFYQLWTLGMGELWACNSPYYLIYLAQGLGMGTQIAIFIYTFKKRKQNKKLQ